MKRQQIHYRGMFWLSMQYMFCALIFMKDRWWHVFFWIYSNICCMSNVNNHHMLNRQL